MQYNALIREYAGGSLKICARVLVADLNDFPTNWKIRHAARDVDRNTTRLEDLFCCPQNPLQIYKPIKNGFLIKVCLIDGKSFEIEVSSQDTVKLLKQKIFQVLETLPPTNQKLYFSGKKLFSEYETMSRCNIVAGSTIYLKPVYVYGHHASLGFRSVDIRAVFSRRINTGQSTKKSWGQLSAGMNFAGQCSNPKCVSKDIKSDQEVVSKLGYGHIQLNFVKGKTSLQCTACSDVVEAQEKSADFQIIPTMGLLSFARALIWYKTESGISLKMVNVKSLQIYERFDFPKNLEAVDVTTVEPWRSPFSCVKCDVKILFKYQEFRLSCGHVYHYWCGPSICNLKCKVCHSKTFIVGSMIDVIQNA